jgi:hypothetical protein
MFSCQRPITRRTLLRGAGAALGLPWLEAMESTARAAPPSSAPVRMAVLYMPNGVHPRMWTPQGEGRSFTLSPTLEPLQDLKDDSVILSNLWNEAANETNHYVKISGFLTSTRITRTRGVDLNCNGISMDQLAAQKAGHLTPLPSLELGISPVTTGVDLNSGYTRVYGCHVAWSGPTTPLARELNPQKVFDRLFRAANPHAETGKRDKLLLDWVLEDANRFRRDLGGADRRRMEEYLDGVRSLEDRLERAGNPERSSWRARAKFDPKLKPHDEPFEHTEQIRLMLDMIVLAFQTDTTRICTFVFGNEFGNETFSFLPGVEGTHHEISHHENNPGKLRQYQIINRWHVEQFAYILRKLRDIKEGETSLLDSSMILFGSGMRDGNGHTSHDLPVVLSGRGGGRIATGRHLVYSEDSPLSNVYLSMLDVFGTPVERFADSSGPARWLLS